MELYSKAGLLDLKAEELAASLQNKDQDTASISPKEYDSLREAHSELQLMYRERTLELETMAATLASHSHTYKALENQVSEVKNESLERELSLGARVKDLQDTIRRRDHRCQQLEAQILATQGDHQRLDDLASEAVDAARDLTRTLDLGRHDNMLEFHIAGVTFEATDLGRIKTFVSWTVPFALEDPLQHTNVALGSPAKYSHSTLYKFHMTQRNLESLRQDPVTVSVYLLLDTGHPAKVGECGLSFSEVLDHPRNTLHGTAPVTLALDHPHDARHFAPASHMEPGQVMGSLSYWFRLQRPCEEVIAQHLRSIRLIGSLDQSAKDYKFPRSITPANPRRVTAEVPDRGTREPKKAEREVEEPESRGEQRREERMEKKDRETREERMEKKYEERSDESLKNRDREEEESKQDDDTNKQRRKEKREEGEDSLETIDETGRGSEMNSINKSHEFRESKRELERRKKKREDKEEEERERRCSSRRDKEIKNKRKERDQEIKSKHRERRTPNEEETENESPSPVRPVPAPRSHMTHSENNQESARTAVSEKSHKLSKQTTESISTSQTEEKREDERPDGSPRRPSQTESITSTGTCNIESPRGTPSNNSDSDNDNPGDRKIIELARKLSSEWSSPLPLKSHRNADLARKFISESSSPPVRKNHKNAELSRKLSSESLSPPARQSISERMETESRRSGLLEYKSGSGSSSPSHHITAKGKGPSTSIKGVVRPKSARSVTRGPPTSQTNQGVLETSSKASEEDESRSESESSSESEDVVIVTSRYSEDKPTTSETLTSSKSSEKGRRKGEGRVSKSTSSQETPSSDLGRTRGSRDKETRTGGSKDKETRTGGRQSSKSYRSTTGDVQQPSTSRQSYRSRQSTHSRQSNHSNHSHYSRGDRDKHPPHHTTTESSEEDTDSEGVVAIPSRDHKSVGVSVYVEVVRLVLGESTTKMLAGDPLVDLLFVDYHGFLGLPPDQLETPLSLPKPPQPHTPLDFKFGQELSVDPRRYPERWVALGDLMRARGIIKFTITSEPPPHLQDTHDCQDLGYVFVDLHSLVDSGQDLEEEELPVESAEDGGHLGTLTLTLRITQALSLL